MELALLVLPDCLLVALGWFIHNRFHYSREFFTGLEKLVYYFLFPALMIRSLSMTPISLATTGNFLLICLLLAVIGALLAYGARFALKPEPISLASTMQCAYRFNTYIGLSIAPSLAGAEGLSIMAVLIGFSVPIVNVFAVRTLAKHQGGHFFKELLKNPLVISTLIGLALNFMGIRLPGFLDTTFAKLSQSAIPLGLICVGAALILRAGGRQDTSLISWMLVIRLMLMPLIGFALASAVEMSAIQTQMVILFAALPTASAAYILAVRMGNNGRIVATTISLGTIFSMLTIPFWIYMSRLLITGL